MDELIKLFGLNAQANASDVQAKAQELLSENSQNKELVTGLRNKVEALETRVTELAKGSRDQRVEQSMNLVQEETKRFLGKDNTEKLKAKASQYVMASEEERRKELYEDMKTICVAYGDNKAMREELNSISGERESSENDTPAHERQVEKLVSKFGMKYSEAIDIVTSGNFEKKIAEEAE